ncbi:RodZ domain-containing protein [Paenibacillus lutimineralis]|uniref:Helix-turn-helix domain-containing protein n=1 Tax=Paenibacillus lutimineralis TaxID=2707005 RepID=A0A3Q9ICK9_9BACL|nr:RodZ domain-containing protein [Paenibacillus lutimineralis]AZS16043.1 helix-turn-helix domain-containing protein [Paenibacillus lutimineralis]
MSDLGQQLKEARLSMGLSLDDVQEITKIRKRYLEAIEAGDYKVLPGSFYVRAFIKTYAEAVGINADELLAEHKQNVPEAVPDTTMEPVLQKRRSRQSTERNSKWLTTALMWSFFALIVIVIYLYFTVWSQSNEAKTNEPDPTAITNNSENPQNNTKPNSNAGTDQDGAKNTNAGTDDQTGTPDNGSATDTNTTDPNDTDTTNKEIVVAPDGKEGSTTKFKVQPVGSEPVKVVITAKGSSWVEVRKVDKRGEKLYYQTMQDGEVLNYDLGEEGLFIKSGASPNTTITVGGQVVEDGKNTSKIQLNLGKVDTTSDSNSANNSANSSNVGTDGAVAGQ